MDFILATEASAPTMQSLIDNLTPMINNVFTTVGRVGTTIIDNPLLLMTTGFLVVGGAIGIFGRLLSRN